MYLTINQPYICRDKINNYFPEIIYMSLRGQLEDCKVSHDRLRKPFSTSFHLCSLNSRDILSTLPGNGEATWLYHPHLSSKPSSIFIPFLHTAYSRNNMYIILIGTHLIFFLCNATHIYIMHIKY